MQVLPYLLCSKGDAMQALQTPLNARHVEMLVQSWRFGTTPPSNIYVLYATHN